MPDKQPSPEAMQAAQAILDACLDGLTFSGHIEEVAAIIDEHTKPKWIKCSERMPIEENGNNTGKVIFFSLDKFALKVAPWTWGLFGLQCVFSHWTYCPDDPELKDG